MTPRRSYEVVVSGRVSGAVRIARPADVTARSGATTAPARDSMSAMLAGALRRCDSAWA